MHKRQSHVIKMFTLITDQWVPLFPFTYIISRFKIDQQMNKKTIFENLIDVEKVD